MPPCSRNDATIGTRSTSAELPATACSSRQISAVVLLLVGSLIEFRDRCVPSPKRSSRKERCVGRRVHIMGVSPATASATSWIDGCSRRRCVRSMSTADCICTTRSFKLLRKSADPCANDFFATVRFSKNDPSSMTGESAVNRIDSAFFVTAYMIDAMKIGASRGMIGNRCGAGRCGGSGARSSMPS